MRLKFLPLLCVALAALHCSKGEEKKETQQQGEKMNLQSKAPTQSDVDPAKKYFASIKTNKGNIKVELFSKETPLSVTNFVKLAKEGFYKGLTFHRVVPGFVVQGGDPTGTGRGGPGYTIPAEIKLPHTEGAVAWARLPETDPQGNPVNPKKESSGSQFYITLAPQPSLDGGYTVFGQTVEGLDVVKKIERGDVIQDITVEIQ